MKKEYIAPMAVVRSLEIENAFCLDLSDSEGDGVQFGKEYDDDDIDDEDFWD